jgi:calcineurin-like phosphoesterase
MAIKRTRKKTKPQSLWTSTKVSVEAGARGISETIEGFNDLVELGRDVIAATKATNRREDSVEFAQGKADDLAELYNRVAELQATGTKVKKQVDNKEVEVLELSPLVEQQIATLQKSIAIISDIEIEYK